MQAPPQLQTVVILHNDRSGRANLSQLQSLVQQSFDPAQYQLTFVSLTTYESLSSRLPNLAEIDLLIAAGGDGTVAAAATLLHDINVPLAILPLGTSNALARELGIPLDLTHALQLLSGAHQHKSIDLINLNGRMFTMNVGVGITAETIKATQSRWKRLLGRLAYVITSLQKLVGVMPHRFVLQIDDQRLVTRAREVIVFNGSKPGGFSATIEPDARLDDGRMHIYVIRSRHLLDYLTLFRDFLLKRHRQHPSVKYFQAHNRVGISTESPLEAQGDGDIWAKTPFWLTLKPKSITIIVPPW